MEEFEIKFLEVDVPELEKKLLAIGAEKVGEYDYSRSLFDYPDFRLNKNNSWIKIRTDGRETTLSFKQRLGIKSIDGSVPDEGMKEIEVDVSSYDKTYDLMKAIGFVVKREEKNRRIRYEKGDVVFDIDFWPLLPPFIEIESDSIKSVKDAARELGFNPEEGMVCSPQQVYTKYGINATEYSLITFEKQIKK